MITFTPAAKKHILSQLKNHQAFYVAVKETGCSGYMYQPAIVDHPKKTTDIFLKVDEVAIYIDKASADIIKGTEIDFLKKSLGFEQLVFHNPNAEGVCGCGESFKLRSEPRTRAK